MDTRTGEIVLASDVLELLKRTGRLPAYLQEMQVAPTPRQMRRRPPRVGRNDPCPCGSGKKFKRCCLSRRIS